MSPVSGVGAATRLYGVLGWPVRHSLSPRMQTAAFAALDLDACYLAFEVAPGDLAAALDGARKLGFGGLNVTVPHKEGTYALLAERDASAAWTGAANTLVPCDGGWKGFNTDAPGLVVAVEREFRWNPRGGRALILGAGGAARAAVYGLAAAGAREILLTGRDPLKTRAVAADLEKRARDAFGAALRAVPLAEAPGCLADGDLLVSATPLGLSPDGAWPWPLCAFSPGIRVYDMAYGEAQTPLVDAARAAGFAAASGRRMLVGQGAEAFRLWTGREPPIAVMERAVGL